MNKEIKIKGNSISLIPYTEEHVVTYNNWMKDKYIQGSEPLSLEDEYNMLREWKEDPNKLIGDVNLFYSDNDENEKQAEINVMIADPKSRGKGFAKEAIGLILIYGITKQFINTFLAVINDNNVPSKKLFQNHFNFTEIWHSAKFEQTTYQLIITRDIETDLHKRFPHLLIDEI